jgi:hypothetical protein
MTAQQQRWLVNPLRNEGSNMTAQTYKEWMRAVDAILTSKVGLSSSDLADFNSRDLYDDGCSPEIGAEECLLGDDTYQIFVGVM